MKAFVLHLYLFFIFIYKLTSKVCHYNLTSLKYQYGDKISMKEKEKCYLCTCEYDGSFSCFEHGCLLLNCHNPKFGEVECCKILKCKRKAY